MEDPIYPIKCQCCPHIETSQLIYCANQLTGFYMRATLALNGLKANLPMQMQLHNLHILKKESLFWYLYFDNYADLTLVKLECIYGLDANAIYYCKSQNRCYKKTKPAKFSEKQKFLPPDMHTRTIYCQRFHNLLTYLNLLFYWFLT